MPFPSPGRLREADSDHAVRQQGRPAAGGVRGGPEVREHRGGRADGEGAQRRLHRDQRQGRQQRLRRPRPPRQVSDRPIVALFCLFTTML